MPYPSGDPQRIAIVDARVDIDADIGRHALDEDALLTPIFHALTGRLGRRPAPVDPVERFRRDPLTAPIPVPVVVPARRRPGAHARGEPAPERTGRHHLRRGPAWLPH